VVDWIGSSKRDLEAHDAGNSEVGRMPLAGRYRADRIFEKRQLRGKCFTDTLDGRATSKDGDRYGQVFANRGYFATVYPMDTKSKAGDALRTFCQEFDVPDRLTCDGSKEQTGKKTEFMQQVRKNDIDLRVIEPERHKQNPCEGVIRGVRRKWLVPWYAVAYEGLFSSSAGIVFSTRKKFPRACVFEVGVVRSQEAKPNYCKSQVEVLGSNPQVRHSRT